MPKGIVATVDGGYATLDFVDKALRGPALQKLVDIGGPGTIETLSRRGPRRQYRVPEGNAREAGLLDSAAGERVPSAGDDTGAASALADADPNANPGDDSADWHTPTAEHTSANAYVAQTPNEDVLSRPQVHTGDASSTGGSASTPTHDEVIGHVLENSSVRAVGGVGNDISQAQREPVEPASAVSGRLGAQPAALGSDPGGYAEQPEVAPEPVSAAPAAPARKPSDDWTRAELDAYARDVKGLDTTDRAAYPTKADVLDAIR